MPRALAQQVVVVTGASSGVGRELTLQLAEHGATVVAAARNSEALGTLEQEGERLGGVITPVPTDVAKWDQVRALAHKTVAAHGRIDTWVNCAAATVYGRATEVPVEEIDRVLDVILRGEIYGMKAALEVMQPAGTGVVVNVASALAVQSVPLQSAYCAAKHGVRGFAQSLRMELRHDEVPIEICTVLPSSVNTPLFRHARSHLDHKPKPVPPVYQPSVVAAAVLQVMQRPQDEVVVGGGGKLLTLIGRFAPRLSEQVLLGPGKAWQKQETSQPAGGTDNLFTASKGPGATEGEFGAQAKSTSLYTEWFELHPQRIRAALGLGAALAVGALRRSGR